MTTEEIRERPSTPAAAKPSQAEHQPPSTQQAQPVQPSPDRTTDADVLLDIPLLAVDELILEIDAHIVLDRVRVEARGLQANLFLKVDLGNVVKMVGTRDGSGTPDIEGTESTQGAVRGDLQHLIESAKEAYDDLSDRHLRDVYERARDAYAKVSGETNGHVGGQRGGSLRALQIAKQGGMAAGLTAAGVAGGALLESRLHPVTKRRASGPKAIIDKVIGALTRT